MAIQQRNINGSFIEIYVEGGGNWMTQTAPTNRHEFYRRKALTADERPEDWREVTDAEKQNLEAADAQWRRPEQSLIDRWNVAFGHGRFGQYNEQTGFFEGNNVNDITEEQAIWTLEYGSIVYASMTMDAEGVWQARVYDKLRTTLPVASMGGRKKYPILQIVPTNLKTIRFGLFLESHPHLGFFEAPSNIKVQNDNLTAIYDLIKPTTSGRFVVTRESLTQLVKLETIYLYNITQNIVCYSANKLSLESFKFMVDNAINTTPITITVHPDVYAKLTDEGNEEWSALNREALEKQITFATP